MLDGCGATNDHYLIVKGFEPSPILDDSPVRPWGEGSGSAALARR
jgi:hypothetical protein